VIRNAKVFVAVPLSQSVHSEFFKTFYMAQLLLPEEGVAYNEICKWGNTVNNRNDLTKTFLQGDYTHLFFMDSDMSFPEATLSRLLHHDKDIVGGFYSTKVRPFRSTAMVKSNKPGARFESYTPQNGETLKQVDALGTGCMLIKRKVIEGMKWPWFYYKPDYELETFATEDVAFCEDAAEKGFETWCDFSIRCGHAGHMVVTPYVEQGESRLRIDAV